MKHFEAYMAMRGYSKATIIGMIASIRRFREWAEKENIPEENTSYNDVLAYIKTLQQKNIKQNTVKSYIDALKHYFDYKNYHEQGIEDNPASNIKIQGIQRRILHDILTVEELEDIYKKFTAGKGVTGKRDKIIVGLMIYQGLRPEDLGKLTTQHPKLREGKIYVPGGRKIDERELTLQAHQIMDLMDYLNEARKIILAVSGNTTDKLFITMGISNDDYRTIADKIMRKLRKQNKRIKSAKQIRASVITNWLKQYNLRQVQYMAGHRYVSSTEMYKLNDLQDLQEDINKYHPVG